MLSTVFFTSLCSFLLASTETEGSVDTGSAERTGTAGLPLLVVSFDGLCAEHITDPVTPFLAQFKKTFASAPYLRSTYRADAYENHFCVATGYCPEENTATAAAVDESEDDMDVVHREEEAAQDDVDVNELLVPIWTQNSLIGKDRHSGIYMWPGVFLNHHPAHYQQFGSKKWKDRVNTFMSWFTYKKQNEKDEKEPANLVMAYFELPSSNMNDNILGLQDRLGLVDTIFGYILQAISKLKTKINMIVLGGHGMSNTYFDIDIGKNNYAPDQSRQVLPAVFMAAGPMFNENTETAEPVGVTEVYPLLKYLLNIDGKDSKLQATVKMTKVMKQLLRFGQDASGEVTNKLQLEKKVADFTDSRLVPIVVA